MAKEEFAGIESRIREVSVSGIEARVETNVKRPKTPGVEARTMFLEQDDSGQWRVSDPG